VSRLGRGQPNTPIVIAPPVVPSSGTAEGGLCTLGAVTTATPKKIAVATGICAVAATSTGTAAKRAPQTGAVTVGFTAQRSGIVARAVSGTCAVGVVTTGNARKVVPVVAIAAGGFTTTSADRKVAVSSGVTVVALTGTTLPRKVALGRGIAPLGLSGAGLGTVSRSTQGACYVGATVTCITHPPPVVLVGWPPCITGPFRDNTLTNGSGTATNATNLQGLNDAVANLGSRMTAAETALTGKADTTALSAAIAAVPEQAQDATAALVAGGTHTGVSFTYDDAGNALSANATGDLPEFASSAQTIVVGTPANMVGKLTRYDTTSGAISQPLPAATAGRVFAIGWDAGTNVLTLTAAGSDVIGSGSATSFVVPLVGEILTYHCTTTGRWRVVGGFKTQTGLDGRYTQRAALAAACTQRLQWLISQDLEDVSIVLVGDSTGVGTGAWFQIMATMIAPSWPTRTVRIRNWNTTTHTYDAPSTLQTGSGSRVVDFYNASEPATNTFFPIDVDFDTRLASIQPTMCLISEGHNEGTSSTNRDVVTSAMINLCESITEVCPSTDLVLVGQNPETNNTNQTRCSGWYRQIAGQRGYGYMSILEAFLADSRWALGTGGGGIMSDAVHPNNAGYTLWATTFAPFFTTYDTTLPVLAAAPSTLLHAQRNLLVNGDFSTYTTSPGAPDNWTAAGSPTVTKDTGTVEDAVKGWSVKVLGSGSAAGEIYQDVNVSRVKGKVVTLVVREFIPTTGSDGTSGQVAIVDDSGTTSTLSSAWGKDGWRWTTITRRISATATSCRIHLYGVNAATAGVAYFDRAALVLGRWPTRAV
jgi:hypothetical protein